MRSNPPLPITPLLRVALLVLGGCSPYVYKAEIGTFASGVTSLKQGYDAGAANAMADRATTVGLGWLESRPVLAINGGCRIATTAPCTIGVIGSPALTVPTPEQEATTAAPIFEALQRYADALNAVTNAADRQAFDVAQSQLSTAVGGAVTAAQAGGNAGKEASAAAGLVLTAGGFVLDEMRYRALRAGVTAAEQAVPVIATTLGRQLVILRDVRMRELSEGAMRLNDGIGPRLARADYADRLGRLQVQVALVETLRRIDPAKAATDMAKAHAALAAALTDDALQVASVIDAVSSFATAAKTVHDVFAAK